MSFTDNQLIFASIFFVVFVIAIGFAYRKDVVMGKVHSKGVWKVVVAIVAVMTMFFAVVRFLGTK